MRSLNVLSAMSAWMPAKFPAHNTAWCNDNWLLCYRFLSLSTPSDCMCISLAINLKEVSFWQQDFMLLSLVYSWGKSIVFQSSEYLGLCYQSRKVAIHPLHRSPFNPPHTHSFSLLCFRRKTFINCLKLHSTRSFLVLYGCHHSTLIIQRSQWGP